MKKTFTETERAVREAAQSLLAVIGDTDTDEQFVDKAIPVLLPLFQQAVAGAYAAAAKHPVHFMFDIAMGCYSSATCGCGKEFDTENTCAEWTAHILALTPADARQARFIPDGCDRDAACNLAKEHEGECSFWGAQVSQLTALFDATYADLQKVKSETCAAIASAEARGRDDAVNMCVAAVMLAHSRNTSNENWATRAINCIRATEAATRTPDSTKEQ